MYSSEDLERLFIRYKDEVYPMVESIQTFCHCNNVPYILLEKWYKDYETQFEKKLLRCIYHRRKMVWKEASFLFDLRVNKGLQLHGRSYKNS